MEKIEFYFTLKNQSNSSLKCFLTYVSAVPCTETSPYNPWIVTGFISRKKTEKSTEILRVSTPQNASLSLDSRAWVWLKIKTSQRMSVLIYRTYQLTQTPKPIQKRKVIFNCSKFWRFTQLLVILFHKSFWTWDTCFAFASADDVKHMFQA